MQNLKNSKVGTPFLTKYCYSCVTLRTLARSFKPHTHDCNKEEVGITASHNFHGKPFKMKLKKFESGNVMARRNFVRCSLYLTLATAHSSLGC